MYSPRGQLTDGCVGSQPIDGRSGSQQGHSSSQESQGGKDGIQPHRDGHQFEYYFHSICTILFTYVSLI